MKLQTYINHGRLMVRCPKCKNIHAVEQTVRSFVCPACWKGLRAQKFETDSFGAMVAVPHVQLIIATRDQAKKAGEEYELQLPPAEVWNILRPRLTENMNWEPHETPEFLREENQLHGLEGA